MSATVPPDGRAPAGGVRDGAARGGAGVTAALLKLADEELVVGHVLTAVAGWGPELEINLALSSIGQDELGHARLLYVLAVGPERDAVNSCIYGRGPAELAACPLAASYTEDWEDLVVKQFLYDRADAHRVGMLACATRDDVRGITDRVAAEERYHVDFWTGWLRATARAGPDARDRVQGALDRLGPLAADLFALPAVPELGLDPGLAPAAHDAWRAATVAELAELGLELPGGLPAAGSAGAGAAPGDLARIVDELQHVHREAPGLW